MKPTEPDSAAGRIVTGVALGIVGVSALASLAAGSLAVLMARTVVTPPRRADEDLRVLDVTASTVTLSAARDSLTPGRYSLWFDDDRGHARIGEILALDARSVTRALIAVDFGNLRRGIRARFGGWFYLSPRELGYAFEDVAIETDLGPAPAWLVPAAEPNGRWVIQVHGRGVRKQETLRAVPVFHDAGYTSLLVSYRNDGDAPATDDYRYALGDREWLDVDAAIGFAVDQGATDIVLMGWSMGGATVLQAATRSEHVGLIRGIVLDSAVVDWRSVLNFQGALLHVPAFIRRTAIATISNPWGRVLTGQALPIDLDRLDFVARADELRQPILLLHSDDDGYVPAEAPRALATARPDIVEFHAFSTARHAKIWNYDAAGWNTAIADWLARIAG